jgi:hypothetical protein
MMGRRFAADGSPLGAAMRFNEAVIPLGSGTPVLHVAAGAGGDFAVLRPSGQQTLIYRFNADGSAVGAPIAFTGSGHAGRDITVGGDGSIIVVLSQDIGGVQDEDVRIYRFNAAGLPQGPVTVANTFRQSQQLAPAIAADADGDFVVVWTNAVFNSPNLSEIAGQRFNILGAPASTGIADVSVDLDAPDTAISLFDAFYDDRDTDAQLTFAVTGNTNASLFTSVVVEPATGRLVLNYAPSAIGSARLTVRATDSSGQSGETSFNVTVLPVLNGTTAADSFLLRRSGTALQLFVNQPGTETPKYTLPLAALGTLTVNGTGGGDILALDLAGGSFVGPGGMRFVPGGGAATLLVTGAGTLELGATPGAGRFSAGGSDLELRAEGGAAVTLHSSLEVRSVHLGAGSRIALAAGADKVLRARTLSIDGGLLELADNALVLHDPGGDAAAALAAVAAQVRLARAAGDWSGTSGVISAAAKDDPRRITGVAALINDKGGGVPLLESLYGQPVPAGALVVRAATHGDTDLSGAVDADDYMRADRGFLAALPAGSAAATWYGGDFNLDRRVTIDDLFLMDAARARQPHPPAPAGGAMLAGAPAALPTAALPFTDGLFDQPLEFAAPEAGFDLGTEPGGVLDGR